MRPTIIAFTALFAAAIALAIPAVGANAAGADTTPVTATVDRMLVAWTKKDAAAFSASFTEDGDFIEPRGGLIHGRAQIGAAVGKQFQQSKAATRASRDTTKVKMVKPDVAVVLAKLSVTTGSAAPGGALATMVMVKSGSKWQISLLQVVTGGGAPAGGKK